MHTVYRFISPSGKSYVGQTKRDPKLRKYEHLISYRRWVKKDRPRTGFHVKFFYALDKYPPEEWTFEVLREGILREEVDSAEQELIAQYDSFANGYNMTGGGMGLGKMKLTEEHKRKQSEARKAYFASPDGLAWKEELAERARTNNFAPKVRGPMSDEWKVAISKAKKKGPEGP